MNTVWSMYIQNIGTLYSSRSLRFSDDFKDQYVKVFDIADKKHILEIGCGPGALAESLGRWYPDSSICGIDRDSNFISFASERSRGIKFLEGDATALPFENNSFDVTISNTVAEHIEPSKFYGEQHRVLKKNGVCLVLSARRSIMVQAPCVSVESEFEKELWQRTDRYFSETFAKFNVCEYPQNESELPLNMEKYGFHNVTTEYITLNLTPDAPCYSKDMAYAMINANRQNDLDNADKMLRIAGDVVTLDEVNELKRLINAKYDKRLYFYDRGVKQWDTNISVAMVVRGIK